MADLHHRSQDLRRQTLRDHLPISVDLLRHCRASDIPPGYIDDYVSLDWLEWNHGSLRLTTVGENICRQVRMQTVRTDEGSEAPAGATPSPPPPDTRA